MARVAKGATNAVALCIRPSNHRNVDVVISAICLWTGVRCWHDRVRAGGGVIGEPTFYELLSCERRANAKPRGSALFCVFGFRRLCGDEVRKNRQSRPFKCGQKTLLPGTAPATGGSHRVSASGLGACLCACSISDRNSSQHSTNFIGQKSAPRVASSFGARFRSRRFFCVNCAL